MVAALPGQLALPGFHIESRPPVHCLRCKRMLRRSPGPLGPTCAKQKARVRLVVDDMRARASLTLSALKRAFERFG